MKGALSIRVSRQRCSACSQIPNSSTVGSVNRQASLQVREGEILGVAGLVGCGKTELGLAIAGAVPSTGKVRVLGQELAKIQEPLEDVRAALKKPIFDAHLNYDAGFSLMLPHLARVKTPASYLSAATLNALHEGDLEKALADLGIFSDLLKIRAWRAELAKRPSVRTAVGADYPQLLRAFLVRHDAHLLKLAACGSA